MYTFITRHTHTHLLVFFPSHLRTRCIHEEKKDILLLGHSVHMYAKSLSSVQPFAALWTIALQVSLSMGFTRQEYCSGLPCPPAGDCPTPGIEPVTPEAPASQVGSLLLSHRGSPSDHNTVAKFGNFNIVMIFLSNETLSLNLGSSLSTIQIP